MINVFIENRRRIYLVDMKEIENSNFQEISLGQMEDVRFMNRIDRKFCMGRERLPELLDRVREDYYILTINNNKKQAYNNIYLDSHNNMMYNDHVRGKLNRYKVRFRKYELSGDTFLEVKHKIPTGKTFKKRIECDGIRELSSDSLSVFLDSNLPSGYNDLRPVLINRFTRITLVNKEFNERCTIDVDISYEKNGNVRVLKNFVVVEVKSDLNGIKTPLVKALREMRIRPTSFSKYCFGRTWIDSTVKSNAYRPKLREIIKLNYN